MTQPILLSIQVGVPREIKAGNEGEQANGPWTSGFVKEPVEGPIFLGNTNLEGDGQADLKNHGGPDKAVNSYPVEHYSLWLEELGRPEITNGAFGENFTTQGLLEDTVCIGDTYEVGEARIQVSQPRQPCWKISRRWDVRDFAQQVQDTGRTGWYFRVIREGAVERNTTITLLERPCPEWTVARANNIMHKGSEDRNALLRLSELPYLSKSWQSALAGRIRKFSPKGIWERLKGPGG